LKHIFSSNTNFEYSGYENLARTLNIVSIQAVWAPPCAKFLKILVQKKDKNTINHETHEVHEKMTKNFIKTA
jgi:hypothetical protein